MSSLSGTVRAASSLSSRSGGNRVPLGVTAYYLLRPAIPRKLQLFARRWWARRVRRSNEAVWPIDPSAGIHPKGWHGWPEGKGFAFLLTHDIEGARGVGRVPYLMDMEEELGFRSSFNFVGGDYSVPGTLLEEIVSRGFEIGVHGLHHNGLMYAARWIFRRHAFGINRCAQSWKATGFRSPSMHRRLEWIHELDIEYDLSTFDTDPFEPFPDGVGTIFPFWLVNKARTHGYVELPYTLPQDFTVFVILREATTCIWKKKLEWIADRGGMALLNVHPDYLCPEGGKPGPEEYPERNYREFLRSVKAEYSSRYWHATPADLVRWFLKEHPLCLQEPKVDGTQPHSPLRVCMPTYSFYESDNRVRRYAETLARRGDDVSVICLRSKGAAKEEVIDGVKVHRIQRRSRDEKRKITYLLRTLLFLLRSTMWLTRSHLRQRYDLVHVHNIPDFEVISAAVPWLTGTAVILDIHDIVPELFCSKFNGRSSSWLMPLLRNVERLSCNMAHHVIVANHIWRDRLVTRSVGADRCTVFLNYPDLNLFSSPVRKTDHDPRPIVLYPGTLNYHQGLDLAIDAFTTVAKEIPEAELHIYGDGPERERLILQAGTLGLSDKVVFHAPVDLNAVPKIMRSARLGIVPKRAAGFGNEAFSTKIFEFMGVGVPVVVAETAIDRYYFPSDVVAFFQPENVSDLARRIVNLLKDSNKRERLRQSASAFVGHQAWAKKEGDYLYLVDALVQNAS